MSESNTPDPLSLHEKGPLYSKLIAKVSDTSEGGLETIIFEDMLARGWLAGNRNDYDRQHCIDLAKLKAFLDATQPEVTAELKLDSDNPTRKAFRARMEKEVAARGYEASLAAFGAVLGGLSRCIH